MDHHNVFCTYVHVCIIFFIMQSSYNSRTVAPRTMNYKHPLIELLCVCETSGSRIKGRWPDPKKTVTGINVLPKWPSSKG